ncbi:hypothetical protein BGZ47_000561, partial [Haplosporangium gracile]
MNVRDAKNCATCNMFAESTKSNGGIDVRLPKEEFLGQEQILSAVEDEQGIGDARLAIKQHKLLKDSFVDWGRTLGGDSGIVVVDVDAGERFEPKEICVSLDEVADLANISVLTSLVSLMEADMVDAIVSG